MSFSSGIQLKEPSSRILSVQNSILKEQSIVENRSLLDETFEELEEPYVLS